MQLAKLTADAEFAEPPVLGELPAPGDEGLALHAAASRPTAAVAMMAAAVRPIGGHVRRGQQTMPMLSFIMGIGFMPAVLHKDG
jgi:hypothetical protein